MGKYMIIRREEYEMHKETINRLMTTNNKVSKDIEFMDSRINALSILIQHTLEKLQMTESARRTNASKIGGLTTSLNKEKKENEELQNKVKDLEVKLEESMSDKYLVKKIPAGRRPKTQTMKLKSCTVQSNIARKMFGDSK